MKLDLRWMDKLEEYKRRFSLGRNGEVEVENLTPGEKFVRG